MDFSDEGKTLPYDNSLQPVLRSYSMDRCPQVIELSEEKRLITHLALQPRPRIVQSCLRRAAAVQWDVDVSKRLLFDALTAGEIP